MSPLGISLLLLALLCLASVGGVLLPRRLPSHHSGSETRAVVQVGATLLATLTSVVLGLLLASEKASFDGIGRDIQRLGEAAVLLDQALRDAGPVGDPARAELRHYLQQALAETWPAEGVSPVVNSATSWLALTKLGDLVRGIDAARPAGGAGVAAAGSLLDYRHLVEVRWQIIEESGSTISLPLLLMLGFWLVLGFFSLSYGAPANAFMHTTLFLLAFAVTVSVFIILELDGPFTGLINVSPAPLREALAYVS
jgi:hypothetical protein